MPEDFKLAPKPDFALAGKLIGALKKAHWDNEPERKGMHAYGYTKAEQEAIDIVVAEGVKLGMEAFSDLAGNMYLLSRGTGDGAKTDVIVSHLDTVEKGGVHDGRDGVVAGIAVVAGFKQNGIPHEHDICVMIARSEESDINGQVSIGAKAATGSLSQQALSGLNNRKTGRSLWLEMNELGIPISTLAGRLDASPTLFPTGDAAKALIGFLVEAHIEQGSYCAKQDINIGIVNAIRGNTRFLDAKITGEAAHSGATFEEDRADANRAYVKLMHAAEEWFDVQRRHGRDVVFTPGKVKSNNESATTVSDNITFSFEIRSADEKVLQDFATFMKTKAEEIVSSHPNNKLKIELPKANIAKPAEMDKEVIAHAQAIANELGVRSGIVTSGAGHDTVQFANTGTPSVMLFIKQDDPISHNPREARREDSFKNACKIIAGMIMNPQERTQEPTLPPEGPKSFREYIAQQGAVPYEPGQWKR